MTKTSEASFSGIKKNRTILFPLDIVLIPVPAAALLEQLDEVVELVSEETVRVCSDKIDGVVNLKVNKGLGEIMEGLPAFGNHHEDLPGPVADGFPD